MDGWGALFDKYVGVSRHGIRMETWNREYGFWRRRAGLWKRIASQWDFAGIMSMELEADETVPV